MSKDQGEPSNPEWKGRKASKSESRSTSVEREDLLYQVRNPSLVTMQQTFNGSFYACIVAVMFPILGTFGAEPAPPAKPPAPAKPTIYRLSQVEEAKKRAQAEGKPIAWIGSYPEYLEPYTKPILGRGSHAATAYAIAALQKETILVFSDGRTENHTEPAIVDQALHSPNPHYTIPYVIILTPTLDKVICKAPYAAESADRIKVYTEVLKIIRDKESWNPKPPEEKPAK